MLRGYTSVVQGLTTTSEILGSIPGDGRRREGDREGRKEKDKEKKQETDDLQTTRPKLGIARAATL